MKLYQTIDGDLIGFYKERGGQVQAMMYRDVYETVVVEHSEMLLTITPANWKQEQYWIPGNWFPRDFLILERVEYQPTVIEAHWEYKTWTEAAHWGTREYWLEPHTEIRHREVAGYFETTDEYIQGHSETQDVWIPETTETKYREVAAHTEIQEIWVSEYYVTRYYWREAHPARGLEAAWIPYEHLIPAGFKDQRVWVEAGTEPYQAIVPGYFELQRVWVEGHYDEVQVWHKSYFEPYEVTIPGVWQERRIWFPEVTRTTKTWQPLHEEMVLVTIPEHHETRVVWVPIQEKIRWVDFGSKEVWTKRTWFEETEVWLGYEPVYEFVDESQVRLYEVVELTKGAGPGPEFEDVLTIRNMLTGEELKTYATYMGLAERIADNEFVVPSK